MPVYCLYSFFILEIFRCNTLLVIQAGVIEEFVDDALDTALDSEDIEEETEEEVERVLSEIAGETAAQLPEAVRKERTKVAAQRASASQEVCVVDSIFISFHCSLQDAMK